MTNMGIVCYTNPNPIPVRKESSQVMNDFPEMMTPQQAADFLQCTRENIYRRLRRGTLPGFRIGHEWRVPKSELIAMARANLTRKAAGDA